MATFFSKEDASCTDLSDEDTDVPFKKLLTKNQRENSYEQLKEQHPECIPVIIEKAKFDKFLPRLPETKFLLYPCMQMSEVMILIRNEMELDSIRAVYLMVRTGLLVSMSKSLLEIYAQHKDPDGFLYLTYASEDMFG